jgi:hypothetical protein
MKNKIKTLTLSLLLISTFSFAQKNIEASSIIKEIKEGTPISYKDITIIGVLDFTFMEEAIDKTQKKK